MADEYYFEEGCYITELHNRADDPAVSVARARVPPGVTTRWHTLGGITERYVIEAALSISGMRLYSTALPVPVLTDGHPATATLDLVSGGMTATTMSQSELTKREFADLESQLGGMRRVTGKRVDGDVSVGWDAFKEDNVLRMAREQVNLDNESRVSYRYAYKAGQPWYVVREKDNGLTSQVAWDNTQRVILNEQSDGTQVGDDDIAALHARAAALAEAIGSN